MIVVYTNLSLKDGTRDEQMNILEDFIIYNAGLNTTTTTTGKIYGGCELLSSHHQLNIDKNT